MIPFKISGEYIELIKLLKATGLCDTGGMAKAVTADGLVTVDGMVETRKRKKVRPGQVVEFAGESIRVDVPGSEATGGGSPGTPPRSA